MGRMGGGADEERGGHRLADIKKHCAEEFRAHWDCLENNNHKLFSCRAKENPYNSCVLKYLVSSGLSLVLRALRCFCSLVTSLEVTLTRRHPDNRTSRRSSQALRNERFI